MLLLTFADYATRDTFKKISESDYNGLDTLITLDSDSSQEDGIEEGHTSKRNMLHRQQHNKKKHQQQEDAFLTVPMTNTNTNTTSILEKNRRNF